LVSRPPVLITCAETVAGVAAPSTLPFLLVLARVSLAVALRAKEADEARRSDLPPVRLNKSRPRYGGGRIEPGRDLEPTSVLNPADTGMVHSTLSARLVRRDITAARRTAVLDWRGNENGLSQDRGDW
jgi:hypothetical protein